MNTPHEAIVALTSQFKLGGRRHRVRIVDHDSDASIVSPIRTHELHVVPDFSGGGGFAKILIGIVVIVVAVVLSVVTFGGASPLLAPASAFAIGTFGASLILGGILDLISPAPKTDNSQDPNAVSRYLGAPKNTVAIGTRIPVGYGRFQVYGQYLSYNVEADPAPTAGGTTKTASEIRAEQGYAT